MTNPVLVVMAAGMGSRYGGLKQLDPVGPNGQAIMDYSLYDAMRAGFTRAVFVISEAMEADFPEAIRARVKGALDVRCAVQRVGDIPAPYALPQGRVKPWGTGHAVLSCRGMVDAPFAVINADDYYGPSGFQAVYDFLRRTEGTGQYAMVGYELMKTLSKTGHVARGICEVSENGQLVEIRERTHIIDSSDGALFTEDEQCYRRLPRDAVASMNLWGFTPDFLQALQDGFADFLEDALQHNPEKGEYFLPEVVGRLLRQGRAQVDVLPCSERWYGVTYREDKPVVETAIQQMTEAEMYPARLWT